tara:strand:- start:4489 stop:4728 length:240 start_codon:yes stop_codon:yes gene_type:complete
MPRYTYQCESCDEYLEITHGMKEQPDPCECGEILTKIPSMPLNMKLKEGAKKVGDTVNSYIEDSRDDLAHQKKEMESKR